MSDHILYVGLWADPPYDRISERFAHLHDDCAAMGLTLGLHHLDHASVKLQSFERPLGVILSGSRHDLPCASDPQRSHRPITEYANLLHTLHRWAVPVLGICYGHQLMALSEGCQLGTLPHKRRRADHPISVIADDPVLGPAGCSLSVPENHQMVVSAVDEQRWHIIARSCDGIEAIRHRHLPWLGLQFHPEYHRECPQHDPQTVFLRWLHETRQTAMPPLSA